MRVALVHDDLVQWGGAERVFLAISDLFPNAPIYTSIFDHSNPILIEKLKGKKIITSFMQKIPGWRYLYKSLLPLYSIAFEQFDFSKYDLVISHTTRFAKAIITKPQTLHLSYCHTPPRFLWNFSGEKVNKLLTPYLKFLKYYDVISSNRVDQFIAGSENARERIKKIYKRESGVLYPFVEERFFKDEEAFEGNYFLIVSRLTKYKKIDLVIKLFNKLGYKFKIVGVGPEYRHLASFAKENVELLGRVSEELLLRIIAGCRALIIAGEEDFGITSLEAQAMGKPIIAYKAGGALETVIEGKTGIFFSSQDEESLKKALQRFLLRKIDSKDCVDNAKRFSKEIFQKKLLQVVKSKYNS